MAFLQASAGPVELDPGDAGIIDARGMTTLTGVINAGAGSSTGALQITRVPSVAATSHSDASTDLQAMLLAGASSGVLDSTGVDWPFYWASFNSTSTTGTTTALVVVI